MNFARPGFLVRANLVFVGIRYKHKASKASRFYTTNPNSLGLRAAHPAQALAERSHPYPIPDRQHTVNNTSAILSGTSLSALALRMPLAQ